MYQESCDAELLQLLIKGDIKAFDEIYRRYWEPLSKYAYRLTRSSDEVCDIVQDVFVSIWKRRQDLNISGTLKSYLFKCIQNLSLRYIQKNIHHRNYLATLTDFTSGLYPATSRDLECSDIESKLNGVVAKLPGKMQTIFVMSRRQYLSHKEIADQLGIAETTVKKQVGNALKYIRGEVKEMDLLLLIGLLSFLE